MEVRSVTNNQPAFGANTATVKVAEKNTWSICSIGQFAKEEEGKKADSKKADEPSCWSKLVKSVTDFFNNIIAWFKDKLCCCCGDETFFKVIDGKKGEKLLKTLENEKEKITFTLDEGDTKSITVEGDMKKMPVKGHDHFVKVVAELLKANKDHSVEVPVEADKALVELLDKQFAKASVKLDEPADTHLSYTVKVEPKKEEKKSEEKKDKEVAGS